MPESASPACRRPHTVDEEIFFRPSGLGSSFAFYPRLAPWALFLRRSAARIGEGTMKSGVGLALFVVVTALMPADSAQTAGNSPRATPAAKMQFSFGRYWNGCGPVDQPTSGMTLTTVRSRCKKPDGLPDPPYINMQ